MGEGPRLRGAGLRYRSCRLLLRAADASSAGQQPDDDAALLLLPLLVLLLLTTVASCPSISERERPEGARPAS